MTKIVSQQFITSMTSQHVATQMAPILKPARFGCCSSLHYTLRSLASTANHLTHTRDNWEGEESFLFEKFSERTFVREDRKRGKKIHKQQ